VKGEPARRSSGGRIPTNTRLRGGGGVYWEVNSAWAWNFDYQGAISSLSCPVLGIGENTGILRRRGKRDGRTSLWRERLFALSEGEVVQSWFLGKGRGLLGFGREPTRKGDWGKVMEKNRGGHLCGGDRSEPSRGGSWSGRNKTHGIEDSHRVPAGNNRRDRKGTNDS